MSEIESVLQEDRQFAPAPEFVANARIADEAQFERMYQESVREPDAFWGRVANELPSDET